MYCSCYCHIFHITYWQCYCRLFSCYNLYISGYQLLNIFTCLHPQISQWNRFLPVCQNVFERCILINFKSTNNMSFESRIYRNLKFTVETFSSLCVWSYDFNEKFTRHHSLLNSLSSVCFNMIFERCIMGKLTLTEHEQSTTLKWIEVIWIYNIFFIYFNKP